MFFGRIFFVLFFGNPVRIIECFHGSLQRFFAECTAVKQTIAEKKARQFSAKQSERRIDEILTALDALKNHPIEYDNQAVRQIIECIKVLSAEQILIIYKGGLERTVQLTAE